MTSQTLQEKRSTQAVLAFQPSNDCPFVSTDDEVLEAQNSLVRDDCHCQYVVEGGCHEEGTVTHATRRHDDDCACHVFGEYDCVPNILSVEDNTVVVKVYLSDPGVTYDLVTDLRAVSDHVALRRLTNRAAGVGTNTREVDLATLTGKQRRALELAVERGYYERPHNVSLTEIADDLDISKQALSQRLHAAEQKTFEQLIDR